MKIIILVDEIDFKKLLNIIIDMVEDFYISIYDELCVELSFNLKILSPIPLILNRWNGNQIILRLNYQYFNRIGLWHIDIQDKTATLIGNSAKLFHTFAYNVGNLMNGVLLQEYLVFLHHIYCDNQNITLEEYSRIAGSLLFAEQVTDQQMDIIFDAIKNLNAYLAHLQENCEHSEPAIYQLVAIE